MGEGGERNLGEDLQHLRVAHADALEEVHVDPGGFVDDHAVAVVVDQLGRRHAVDHLSVIDGERTHVVHETEDARRLLCRV